MVPKRTKQILISTFLEAAAAPKKGSEYFDNGLGESMPAEPFLAHHDIHHVDMTAKFTEARMKTIRALRAKQLTESD